MTQEDYRHPIAPPPELVQQWLKEFYGAKLEYVAEASIHLAARAAQWGADQELEACCEWLAKPEVALTGKGPNDLRAARRPKPPSLKEQALAELEKVDMLWDTDEFGKETIGALDTIRRALEQLPDNE
jgi:hypothetical protein